MSWESINYKNAYKGLTEVNYNQAKRFLSKLEKIYGTINNILETIINVDLNNTNEGSEYLELESPNNITIQSVYIAYNMRIIELLNAFVRAHIFLNQTVGAGGLGSYIMTNTDIHIQNLHMLLKLLPQIKVTYNGTDITDVSTINPIITSSAVEPDGDEEYKIVIGLKEYNVTLYSFSTHADETHIRISEFFINNTHNMQITQPLLAILRSISSSVESMIKQAEKLIGSCKTPQ